MNVDDKSIVRMTIVYADGSMTILVKEADGSLSVERRERWNVLSVKKKLITITLEDMECA